MIRRRRALGALLLAFLIGIPAASPTAAGVDLPPGGTFLDDNGLNFEAAIEAIAAEGITSGCGPQVFCPEGLVTRAQMATFLVRALDLPATGTDFFTDDEGNTHEANINRVAEADITHGCGPTTFCPNGIVTRGQMTAFLHRASRLP
jgi:hypothetical protein